MPFFMDSERAYDGNSLYNPFYFYEINFGLEISGTENCYNIWL